MTEAEFDKVMAVNIKSVYFGSNAFTAQVKKQGTGGAMVNIASVGAHRPRPGLVWYNASKAAIMEGARFALPMCVSHCVTEGMHNPACVMELTRQDGLNVCWSAPEAEEKKEAGPAEKGPAEKKAAAPAPK